LRSVSYVFTIKTALVSSAVLFIDVGSFAAPCKLRVHATELYTQRTRIV